MFLHRKFKFEFETKIEETMSEDSAVKLKSFTRNEDKWVYWAPIILARTEAKEYQEIVDRSVAVPSNATLTANNLAILKLKKLNKTGYSELMAILSKLKGLL